MIKELFYLGKAPASVVSVPYSKMAQTSNPDEETQRSSSNVVFKQVKAIGTEDTSTQKTQDALKDKVDEALELAKNPPKPTTTPTEDALIAKWKGYNFTDSEKGIIRNQTLEKMVTFTTRW
jgi:galactokinase/mevalonate kinase-like predicted kinase